MIKSDPVQNNLHMATPCCFQNLMKLSVKQRFFNFDVSFLKNVPSGNDQVLYNFSCKYLNLKSDLAEIIDLAWRGFMEAVTKVSSLL